MHIGAPACGMNAAVRSFVRNCIYRGDTVYGIHDGVEGLVAGNVSAKAVSVFDSGYFDYYASLPICFLFQVQIMKWADVTGWVGQGGAFLGTKRTLPNERMSQIAARLKEYCIQALLIIGGFEVKNPVLYLYSSKTSDRNLLIYSAGLPSRYSTIRQ